MPMASIAEQIGLMVREFVGNKRSFWYTPFMAAASRAIFEGIPSVDFVLDVRDARVPLSSECEQLRRLSPSSRRLVVLNKVDLAKHSHVKGWTRHFERENSMVFCVNSHNKDNVQEFLNFLQGQVKILKKADPDRHTVTLMLVGIPNVGKSALANALHRIGRISATEKGKLKHALVSPLPGATKNISGLKIASNPNIYVLDTPGILPSQIIDAEVSAKLFLTGTLSDNIAGEKVLAKYFLSILNLSDEYQKWAELSTQEVHSLADDNMAAHKGNFATQKMTREEFAGGHIKDEDVVFRVRTSLFEAISSFSGNLQDEEDMLRLIETQFRILKKALKLHMASEQDSDHKIAVKLLNLFRTGRLGHYTLDPLPISVE